MANIGLNETRWFKNYHEICEYLNAHSCKLNDITKEATFSDGTNIHRWLLAMKKACTDDSHYKLGGEQKRLLKILGIDEFMSVTDRHWYRHFNELLRFYSKNHHLNIPQDWACSDGISLFSWVRLQRSKYQHSELPQKYIDEFRKYDLMEVLETPLETGMRHAEEYFNEFGSLDISVDYVSLDGYRLGVWIKTMREKHMGKRGTKQIPDDILERLDAMGMIWNKQEYIWNENFKRCKAYLETHGDLEIPDDVPGENGVSLKQWFKNNCWSYAHGKLSEHRAEQIRSLGIDEKIMEAENDPEHTTIRNKMLRIRLTEEEIDRFFELAKSAGYSSVSEFVRATILG